MNQSFEKYKNLWISINSIIEDQPQNIQNKFHLFEDPMNGFDNLIDYDEEYGDLLEFKNKLMNKLNQSSNYESRLEKERAWLRKYSNHIDKGTYPENEFNSEKEFYDDVERTEKMIEYLSSKIKSVNQQKPGQPSAATQRSINKNKFSLKELAKIWLNAYGEDFQEEYPGIANHLYNRFSLKELENYWEECFGEDFQEEYSDVYKELLRSVIGESWDGRSEIKWSKLSKEDKISLIYEGQKVLIVNGRYKGEFGEIDYVKFDKYGQIEGNQIDVKLDNGTTIYVGLEDIQIVMKNIINESQNQFNINSPREYLNSLFGKRIDPKDYEKINNNVVSKFGSSVVNLFASTEGADKVDNATKYQQYFKSKQKIMESKLLNPNSDKIKINNIELPSQYGFDNMDQVNKWFKKFGKEFNCEVIVMGISDEEDQNDNIIYIADVLSDNTKNLTNFLSEFGYSDSQIHNLLQKSENLNEAKVQTATKIDKEELLDNFYFMFKNQHKDQIANKESIKYSDIKEWFASAYKSDQINFKEFYQKFRDDDSVKVVTESEVETFEDGDVQKIDQIFGTMKKIKDGITDASRKIDDFVESDSNIDKLACKIQEGLDAGYSNIDNILEQLNIELGYQSKQKLVENLKKKNIPVFETDPMNLQIGSMVTNESGIVGKIFDIQENRIAYQSGAEIITESNESVYLVESEMNQGFYSDKEFNSNYATEIAQAVKDCKFIKEKIDEISNKSDEEWEGMWKNIENSLINYDKDIIEEWIDRNLAGTRPGSFNVNSDDVIELCDKINKEEGTERHFALEAIGKVKDGLERY
jgi:hypothetical protein